MYKLFIVEDDIGIASAVKQLAESWNYDVMICRDFRNILPEFTEFAPHLVLMDISLPFANGYHWCGELRKISNVPIIFISSASDNLNMVMAMSMGADDFIAKPFDSNLLMIKLRAMLRRAYDYAPSSPVISHRNVLLNTGNNTVSYEGKQLELTKNEYRIILTLMQNAGKIVSREKLMEMLWETDSFIDENTLNVNVNRLRKRLADIGVTDFIITKFGIGYILK